ncbi:MAG: diguanylate cyclase, partial [Clostridiales bacterium]|nr:diguanylate cyclase [Clostridiales bacterium]
MMRTVNSVSRLRSIGRLKGRIVRYTLLIGLALSVIYLGISILMEINANRLLAAETIEHETVLVKSTDVIITSRLSRIVSDVLFIKDCYESIDHGETQDRRYTETLRQWLAFVNRRKVYDQVRYLNANGDEVLRVNSLQSGAYVAPESQLQNKADRYYFKDSIVLPADHVYVSRLDLNVENGRIETPVKPTMRMAVPVYGDQPEAVGVIVLNYKGDDLLRQVQSMAENSLGAIYLLNDDGYWLYHSQDSSLTWGFMYEDRADVSFAAAYAQEWDTIREGDNGFLITDRGAFMFDRVFNEKAYQVDSGGYPLTLGSGDWHIVSHILPDTETGLLLRQDVRSTVGMALTRNAYVYGMILLISAVIAVLVALYRAEQDAIRYYSRYDALTGVLNRRAGLEMLSRQYLTNPNSRCQISVCSLDINGLKEINDTLGHEAGDELIVSVAKVIRRKVRENDVIARLGGDEFLIVFEGLDEAASESVWKRVVEGYEKINRTEDRPYLISVSHGIETYRCHADQYLDTIINRADAKMYDEKRILKQGLRVLRNPPPVAPAESVADGAPEPPAESVADGGPEPPAEPVADGGPEPP